VVVGRLAAATAVAGFANRLAFAGGGDGKSPSMRLPTVTVGKGWVVGAAGAAGVGAHAAVTITKSSRG
jgi:hypothetical protein